MVEWYTFESIKWLWYIIRKRKRDYVIYKILKLIVQIAVKMKNLVEVEIEEVEKVLV